MTLPLSTLVMGLSVTMNICHTQLNQVAYWFHGAAKLFNHIHSINRYDVSSSQDSRAMNPLFKTLLLLIDNVICRNNDVSVSDQEFYVEMLLKKVSNKHKQLILEFQKMLKIFSADERELYQESIEDLENLLKSTYLKCSIIEDKLMVKTKSATKCVLSEEKQTELNAKYEEVKSQIKKINNCISAKKKMTDLNEKIVDVIYAANIKRSVHEHTVSLDGKTIQTITPYSFVTITFYVDDKRKKELNLKSNEIKFKIYSSGGDSYDGIPSTLEIWIPKRAKDTMSDINQLLVMFAVSSGIPCVDTINLVNCFRIDDNKLMIDTCNAIITDKKQTIMSKLQNIRDSSNNDLMIEYGQNVTTMESKKLIDHTHNQFASITSHVDKTSCAMHIAKIYHDKVLSKQPPLKTVNDLMKRLNEINTIFRPRERGCTAPNVYISSALILNNLPLYIQLHMIQNVEFHKSMTAAMKSNMSIAMLMKLREYKVRSFFIDVIKMSSAYPLVAEQITCVYMQMIKAKRTPTKKVYQLEYTKNVEEKVLELCD
jgi:hypothetical protein